MRGIFFMHLLHYLPEVNYFNSGMLGFIKSKI
jgi:hypothetical protein